jgi:non-heme chloroperoxidase
MLFLGQRSCRAIAHDRRGHGRSSEPWSGNELDTSAEDLAELTAALDLRDAVYLGHSTGGGEVARYVARHGTLHVEPMQLAALLLEKTATKLSDAEAEKLIRPRRRASR